MASPNPAKFFKEIKGIVSSESPEIRQLAEQLQRVQTAFNNYYANENNILDVAATHPDFETKFNQHQAKRDILRRAANEAYNEFAKTLAAVGEYTLKDERSFILDFAKYYQPRAKALYETADDDIYVSEYRSVHPTVTSPAADIPATTMSAIDAQASQLSVSTLKEAEKEFLDAYNRYHLARLRLIENNYVSKKEMLADVRTMEDPNVTHDIIAKFSALEPLYQQFERANPTLLFDSAPRLVEAFTGYQEQVAKIRQGADMQEKWFIERKLTATQQEMRAARQLQHSAGILQQPGSREATKLARKEQKKAVAALYESTPVGNQKTATEPGLALQLIRVLVNGALSIWETLAGVARDVSNIDSSKLSSTATTLSNMLPDVLVGKATKVNTTTSEQPISIQVDEDEDDLKSKSKLIERFAELKNEAGRYFGAKDRLIQHAHYNKLTNKTKEKDELYARTHLDMAEATTKQKHDADIQLVNDVVKMNNITNKYKDVKERFDAMSSSYKKSDKGKEISAWLDGYKNIEVEMKETRTKFFITSTNTSTELPPMGIVTDSASDEKKSMRGPRNST